MKRGNLHFWNRKNSKEIVQGDFREHWKSVYGELLAKGLPHEKIEPYATYAPWRADPEFLALVDNLADSTLVDIYRLYELWELAIQVKDLPGDVLEVGVWRGGTGALLGRRLKNKTVFLADTFTGVVGSTQFDTSYEDGEHADTSLELVKNFLASMNISNCQLLQGIFPTETGHLMPNSLSFIHIDVDVFQSAKDIWDYSVNALSSGGIVVFDDYGFSSTDGVSKLVNQLDKSNFTFLYNLNGHAILIKR